MGFGNITAARNAQSDGRDQRSTKIPIYRQEVWSLIPDESIIVRFVGGPSEPHIFHQHGFARHPSRGFEKGICAKPGDCVLCQASSVPGEKRVKRASPYAAFTVYSTRKMRLIPVTRNDGTSAYRREPIRVNAQNELIDKIDGKTRLLSPMEVETRLSSESEDEGIKIWCGSLHPKAANADQILALDMQLQKVCQCGGKVGTGLGARPAEIVEKYPGEGGPIECTADCGNPRRGSLTSCYVQITRRGQGTDTTYHFQPLPLSEPNAEHSMAPMDLAEIYKADLNANVEMLEARGISIRQDLNGTSTSDSNIWN